MHLNVQYFYDEERMKKINYRPWEWKHFSRIAFVSFILRRQARKLEKWLEVGKEEWLKENTEHLFDTRPAKTFLRSFVAFFYPVSCVWQIRMRIFRSIAGLARYAALKYFTLNGDPSETARLLSSLRSASLTIQNLCEYKFPWFSPFLSLSLSLSCPRIFPRSNWLFVSIVSCVCKPNEKRIFNI